MDYNLHAHTYLCSHATGTPEEYVKKAISNGVKYMGFSEHIPLRFPDGSQSFYRLKEENVAEYFSMMNSLREKYRDKIEIKIGYEMEYYKEYFSHMLKKAKKSGCEYLILGQHFTKAENLRDSHPSRYETDRTEDLKDYVQGVVDAIKTGVFTYVAHPDIINFKGDMDLFKKEYRKICRASKEYDIPLEINMLGIRDKRNYPNEILLQVTGEEQSPVTFGMDAHSVEEVCDKEPIKKAKELVKKYSLNYIGKARIRSL